MENKKPFYKKLWFWLVFPVALYALVGFVAIPLVLVHVVPVKLQEAGINLTLEKACFNPFTFNASIYKPELKDKHNATAFEVESLHVNLDPLAITKKQIILKNLELQNPQVSVNLDR